MTYSSGSSHGVDSYSSLSLKKFMFLTLNIYSWPGINYTGSFEYVCSKVVNLFKKVLNNRTYSLATAGSLEYSVKVISSISENFIMRSYKSERSWLYGYFAALIAKYYCALLILFCKY